ncbi:unnamed protein product [Arabidopsis arenosa]|uniref:Uncharacterized protein n=1 Tax=Arabidopsis arenosa TaxID=38785 RepID=A0A8S1ZNT8_ARAAE|nr:unnamed protein product [Arabidopsis arenosa]
MKINRNRPINILIVFFLLATARATRNWTNRTHRTVPRVQHAYYAYPHRSCESFSRPYARSMCIELERIHRSSRQPLFSPPPPSSEIDQRVSAKVEVKQYAQDMKKPKRVMEKLYQDEKTQPKVLGGPAGFYDERWFNEFLLHSGF